MSLKKLLFQSEAARILVIASAVVAVTFAIGALTGSLKEEPLKWHGEMLEDSYARHANTPEWVELCEVKLEWRIEMYTYERKPERAEQARKALEASRAGRRCELVP
jgi:hypothetical protein